VCHEFANCGNECRVCPPLVGVDLSRYRSVYDSVTNRIEDKSGVAFKVTTITPDAVSIVAEDTTLDVKIEVTLTLKRFNWIAKRPENAKEAPRGEVRPG